MHHDLTCNQVNALISFYLEDRLNDKLKEYVERHLQQCPKCRKRYEELYNMINKKFKDISENEQNNEIEQFHTQQYLDFKKNLSAYIDNELNDEENIKIKKITISNPLARQDLEKIYTYKKLVHNAFEKTRSDFKDDYAKSVMENITRQELNKNKKEKDPFIALISAFTATIIFLMLSLVWFSMESGIIKFSFHF